MNKINLNDVNINGILLGQIDEKDRSYALCFDAILNNPKAIKYVPHNVVDDEMLDVIFNAGEKYIRIIPKAILTSYAISKIKFQYPDIGIEMGLVPLCDGHIDTNFLNFLLINGEQYLGRLKPEFFTDHAIEVIKLSYPSYAIEHNLFKEHEMMLIGQYKEAYLKAKKIVGIK